MGLNVTVHGSEQLLFVILLECLFYCGKPDITLRYKLINESRLLRKFRFVYIIEKYIICVILYQRIERGFAHEEME